MKIEFSKYRGGHLYVRCEGDLYSYELEGDAYSSYTPFEDMPLEIQERVAILLTAPEFTVISGLGYRTTNGFFLRDD